MSRGLPRRGPTKPVLKPPVRITPVARRDKALKNHLETTHFFDESTNDLHKPYSVPADPTPDDD